jgi:hypothetical protein
VTEEKFLEFMDLYEGRMTAVSGIAQDTLAGDDDRETSRRYQDEMWTHFLGGVDPVALADEHMKDWPSEQRKFAGQSAEDFRREWFKVKERFEVNGH